MSDFLEYLDFRREHLIELTLDHVQVVALSIAIATAIAVTLGVLVYRRPRAAQIVLAVTGMFLTIPSYALFGILIPIVGLGWEPTVIALVMYALLPIVRNTVTGLRGVDQAIIESAGGMGMGRWRRLFRIELPLAWPVIIAGIRVSTLILIGITAIAAAVNGPGLGNDIFAGLARIGGAAALNLVLGGTLAIVALALLSDAAFAAISRFTTSRGIRA